MKIIVVSRAVLSLAMLALFGCARSAQHYLDVGNRDFAAGRYGEASINYRKSINSNPRSAEAHYRLALDALKLGEVTAAYDELTRAAQLAPGRDDIATEKADLALISYSRDPKKPRILYDQVAETAKRLLSKDKKSFDGLRLSGDVLILDGKFDEAYTQYQKAQVIRPNDPKVVLPMVQVLFRLNRGAEGENLAQNVIRARPADSGPIYDALFNYYLQSNRAGDAEALLRAEIGARPGDPTPRLRLADFYHRRQRDSDASSVLSGILSDSKTFPQGHALVGEFYQSTGRMDEALREYRAGLQAQAKDKALYQKHIVSILMAQGKRTDALAQLDAILKENPTDFDSREARAILLRETEDPQKLELAISEMNAILQNDPNNAVMRYNLGLAYLAKGDAKSAKGQLTEAARLAPGYIEPRLVLAELAQKSGNYSETIRIANEVLAIDPGNIAGKLWHAAGLLGNKTYQQAGTELAALLKQNPESMEVNLYLAALDSEQKKYPEAEAILLRLYKPGQKDLRPLQGLLQLDLSRKENDKAMKFLDAELKAAPDSLPVHLLTASAALRVGNLDLAAQQYGWVLSKDPKSFQAYASLGDIDRFKGDFSQASVNYRKAKELAPGDPKITADIAFVESATGQRTDAIANLRKQLASSPDDTVALNNLAYELAESGTDLEEASALAEKAQRMAPGNPGIADTLSLVYVRRGLNDSAIQILNGLIEKYPDQPEFRYHLGLALMQKGRLGDAKAQFNIALSHNPPKSVADKIKEIMSKMG